MKNEIGVVDDAHDAAVLRALGGWQATEAASKRNDDKIAAWLAHDAGVPERRPMVLMEIRPWEGEHGPVRERDLRCRDPWCRTIEYRLRMLRHHIEVLEDDHVATPYVTQHPLVERSGFGVEFGEHREKGANRLSFNLSEATLKRLDEEDFARLKPSRTSVDCAGMAQERARLEDIFAGILPVEVRDRPWQFGVPLTSTALRLVGQDGFMMLLYDNPEGVHRLMGFLRDQHMRHLDVLEAEGALPPNHGADYVGAGSMGLTRDLPAPDHAGRIRTRDRWGGFESQESVCISPEQYGAFIFPYLEPLMARFGKVYYGCCEPVNAVWDWLSRVPNLARVSISAWADEPFMGRVCRERGIVYSRKPSPNYLSFERFDPPALLDHLTKSAECARGCSLEIIQRDIYSTCGRPERLRQWVDLARRACMAWRAQA